MRRLVLKANQFAADAVVAEQRLADFSRYGLRRSPALLDWRPCHSWTVSSSVFPPLLRLFALVTSCWAGGLGLSVLAVATSIRFYWCFVQPIRSTGARGKLARHQWRHRTAVARAAGLLATLLIAPVHAQSYPTQYVATVWQTEQGLPQSTIASMVQDRDGYVWLATGGGLVRFNGVDFKVFDAADLPGLVSTRVGAVYESRSGALWIGTLTSGLIRLHEGVAITYAAPDSFRSRNIRSIREDAAGKLWINTLNTPSGIACFAGDKLEPCTTYQGKEVSEFFLQARDGSMWFRCGKDIVRFGAGGSVATLSGGYMAQEARDGSVWVAFRDQYRLVRYHQGVFSDVRLPPIRQRQWTGASPEQYPEQGILALARDTDGELLLLTPAGLVRAVDGKLSPPEGLPLPANIGEAPKVLSLMVDREGNRWVGTEGRGLFRFRRAPLTAYGKDEGLSDSAFRAVFQDRDGRIWLGGESVYWFDGHQFHLVPGLTSIRTIAQTGDGDLYFGGSGGLYRWRSGVLTRFKVETAAVTQILQDQQGTLWTVQETYERTRQLYRFRDGEFEQIDPDVLKIAEDRDGGLWLASLLRPGLRYVRGGKTVLYDERQGLPRNLVGSIGQDSSGTLWVATSAGPLYRLRDGRFKATRTRDGLTNDIVGILDDGKGKLWFSSDRGIFRLSLQELNDFADGRISSLSPVWYGVAEGMKSIECNGGPQGQLKTRDGRLWFPTMRGVVAIDPNAVNGPPPVVLEEARAKTVTLGRERRTSVSAGSDTFDFTFTALSLSAPERQRFKYRLEPYDKDWVDAGTQRTAHYTNMLPGEYSFQVIAANSYGIWNEQGASVRFVLRPHFYQTNWFHALGAATFLVLLWAAYQLRVRQLQREFNMRLGERLDERGRIARELHDTLLQSFQGLMFSFQAARNLLPGRTEEAIRTLDGAIREGDEAIAEGRDAIQGLRANPGGERDLEYLLTTAGKELARSSGAEGEIPAFHVTVEGARQPLSPLLQDEVYRMAREFLRNAFRHAHASRIEAEIAYAPQFFRLRIRDNGKGIDRRVLDEGARSGHWGLPGVRERAKRIGARLRLWSESGAGTEAELTVPARIAYRTVHRREGLRLFRRNKV